VPLSLTPVTRFTVTADDGMTLCVREWPAVPLIGRPRGVAVVVHGLGEHAGRYAELASHLNAWGWPVVAHDQRGHGSSEGRRGRLPHRAALLGDLARVIDAAHTRHPGPVLLVGHSMGGLVAARFVAGGLEDPLPRWHRPVDTLVLSSPALDLGVRTCRRGLLTLMRVLAPDAAVGNGLVPEWISRDPKVVQAYRNDPQVHDRITARLAHFILDEGRRVRAAAAHWPVPTLLIFSGSDHCVASQGSREFAAAASPALVTAREFGPLFHEIFNEPEKADVYDMMCRWLLARADAPIVAERVSPAAPRAA